MKLNTLYASCLVAMMTSSPAVLAQPQVDEDEEARRTDLGSLTVTARRTEETLQETPVAVSAFSGGDLRDMQASGLNDIQNAVPNLNLVQGRASHSSINAFIRGVGQPDALQTFDPGVGVYVDDVYLSRIQGALLSLYDVERIEVLRGPQGTLYGRNSPGGAIKVITRTPGERTEAIVDFGIGNYGARIGSAYAGGSLSDRLVGSLAGLISQRNGFVTDPVTGLEYNDDDTIALRGKLHFDNGDRWRATLSGDMTRQRTAANLGQQQAPLLQIDLVTGPVVLQPAPTGKYNFLTRSNLGPDQGQDLDHSGLTLTTEYDITENLTFRNITGIRSLETEFWIDFDNSQFSITEALVALDQRQRSNEMQLHYESGAFRGVAGVFLMRETVPSHQEAYANNLLTLLGGAIDFLRTVDDDLETRSKALFVHGDYTFNDNWSVAGGVRFTDDKKTYFRTTTTTSVALPALNGTYAFNAQDSWSAVTPSASVRYTFSDQTMTYLSASRGFKSGGFNGRANNPADTGAFNPEFVWTYELGFKATRMDGRLQTNVAIFHSDYTDFQARVAEDLASFPVINAGKLEINGFEFETRWMPNSDFRMAANLGYLNARYREFFDFRFPNADRSDDNVPFSPEWTFRLAGSHDFHHDNGMMLTFGADASFRSDTWLSVDNQPGLHQPSYWVFNSYLRLRTPDQRWEFQGGVRNLTNEVYKVDAQEFSSVGNIQGAFFGAPRTYTLNVRYHF